MDFVVEYPSVAAVVEPGSVPIVAEEGVIILTINGQVYARMQSN